VNAWTTGAVGGRFELRDLGVGVAAGLAVLVLALVQWGMTGDGWTRGITLGAVLGAVVAISAHRGRVRSAERERAESERQLQLARELHDAVASQVSIVGIQAAAARRVLASDPRRAEAALQAVEVAARAANRDLRRMLATLRSGATTQPMPGLDQIPELVETYRTHGLELDVDMTGLAELVPAAVSGVAYRVVQEALANVLGHAGRVRTRVRIGSTDGALRVAVENDAGVAATDHRGSGLGLQGIRERAELYGGTMEAERRSDGGFRVDVRIPLSGR
jgi:signal transduction histidine kinase